MDKPDKKLDPSGKQSVRHSLSQRFSIALTGVVTLVILVFFVIAVLHNDAKTEMRLELKLTQTLKLAETSLPSSVWQLDYASMADLLDAIFTDETIAYAAIISDDESLARKSRLPFEGKEFSFFKESNQFTANSVDIRKAGEKIGIFQIAISREKMSKEFILSLVGAAVFTLIVIAAISVTCIVLTKRYIFNPLLKLEKSTELIAGGNIEATIVVEHNDEVGRLSRSILNMRDAIRGKIKELEQAEKKYRNIFDNALEGIFQCSPGGYLINVNPSAAKILGYDSPEEMKSLIKNITSDLYVQSSDFKRFNQMLNESGQIIGFEVQYKCKDKSIIWISVNAREVRNPVGKLQYYEGSFLDITQRKQAQQALQESLSRYRLLLDASPIPITVYDPKGRVTYINPAFVETFGWSMDRLIGERLDFVPPHEDEKTREAIARTLKGERVSIESQRLTEDRKLLDVLINAALYTDHKGRPLGIIVTFRDFTELKQAERDLSKHRDHLEQLVEERTQKLTQANQRLSEEIVEHKATEAALIDSKERFRQLAEMLPETVFEMDLFSNFTFRNRASYRTFGYESNMEEAPGNALDSIVPEDHERVIQHCAKILAGEPSVGNEYRAIRKDGSIFPVMIYTNALVQDGEPVGYRGILVDISERKEMEEALRLAKEKADQASRAKSEFLASMSHEIRTPMNAILGMGDLLLESDLSPEQQKYVEILRNSGENLLDIINDILDLSKVEAGQIELESVPINLQTLMDKCCEMMAVKAHSKHLELLCRVVKDTPVHLLGDAARLRQVLINLLGNAIKFTHEGEVVLEVALETRLPREKGIQKIQLLFSVKDTGIGIPLEKQSHIFESFAQADSSTTRKFGGTGLGLTICRRLVEMMGGKIWVESEPGNGCLFLFTAVFSIDQEPGPSEKVPAVDIIGKRILVVDDNATNRLILNETLSGWGAYVNEAENGAAALEEIEAEDKAGHPFDLILLDGIMPVLDGFETSLQLKQRFNHLDHTVMLLTSDDSSAKIARAKKNGVRVCLIKPVKREELKEAIRTALGRVKETRRKDRPVQDTQPGSGKALRILVVEDGEENRMLIRAYLKKSLHRIDMVENGKLGVEKFKSTEYDLVLMDMRMPVMDGYTATRKIRDWEKDQGRPKGVIIALTAHAMKEDRQKCLDSGCSDYLSKPVKKKDLLEMINMWSS